MSLPVEPTVKDILMEIVLVRQRLYGMEIDANESQEAIDIAYLELLNAKLEYAKYVETENNMNEWKATMHQQSASINPPLFEGD